MVQFYLTNRKQLVSIDNCNSTTKTILTGIPKGSVLEPLLLLIWQSGKSLEVSAKKFNQNLTSLSQCLKANKLSLNIKKLN